MGTVKGCNDAACGPWSEQVGLIYIGAELEGVQAGDPPLD